MNVNISKLLFILCFIYFKICINLGFIFDVKNVLISKNFKWRAVEIHTFTNTAVRLTAS